MSKTRGSSSVVDAEAVVAHAQHGFVVPGLGDDLDPSAWIRVPRGVETRFTTCSRRVGSACTWTLPQWSDEFDGMGALFGQRAGRVDRVLHRGGKPQRSAPQRDPPSRDSPYVQQVVDEPAQVVRLALRDVERAFAPRLARRALTDRVPNGGERVSELVARHRRQIVPRLDSPPRLRRALAAPLHRGRARLPAARAPCSRPRGAGGSLLSALRLLLKLRDRAQALSVAALEGNPTAGRTWEMLRADLAECRSAAP